MIVSDIYSETKGQPIALHYFHSLGGPVQWGRAKQRESYMRIEVEGVLWVTSSAAASPFASMS